MKVISFVNRKGGSGKSTVIALLALYWAEKQGKQVCVLDRDRLKMSYAFVEGVAHPNIARYKLGETCDYLLVDTPGGIDQADLDVHLEESHLVIIPVTLSGQDLRGTAETAKLVGAPDNVRLLLNRADLRTSAFKNRAAYLRSIKDKQQKPLPRFKTHLANRAAYRYAATEGWHRLNRAAIEELGKLVKEIG